MARTCCWMQKAFPVRLLPEPSDLGRCQNTAHGKRPGGIWNCFRGESGSGDVRADAASGEGVIGQIHLFPLEKAEQLPDLVVVEDEVEKLMWIVLSYMHAQGGARVQTSTAVLQATCVDSTVIPYLERRLNFSFGCYGCRDATDMASGEAVLGFPASYLPDIIQHLEYLNKKALPHSRGKHAFAALKKEQEGGQTVSCSSL